MAIQECGLVINHDKKELQPHGTNDFPCAGFDEIVTDNPDQIIPWHWHEDLEIIEIVDGRMELRVPGETVILGKGNIAIVNCNILHYGIGAPSCRLHSFVFSPLLLTGSETSAFGEKYISPLVNCEAFSHIIIQDDTKQRALFDEAFAAISSDAFAFEFTVRDKLSAMLLLVYRQFENRLGPGKRSVSTDAFRMEKMLSYIHVSFGDTITLSDIAASAQIGEREALRCFKRSIGESPMQYLLKYRIVQSAQLLSSDGTLSITEISNRCGFESPSYFAKQFKRIYKRTPGQYRLAAG